MNKLSVELKYGTGPKEESYFDAAGGVQFYTTGDILDSARMTNKDESKARERKFDKIRKDGQGK